MDRPRSPVHQIVNALGLALRELGATPAPEDLERWGFAVHAALSAPGREFHNHEHVLALADGSDGDPLDVIAALYHDVVYLQVDQGPPASLRGDFATVCEKADGGWRLLPAPTQAVADVYAVFGRAAGDVVGPMSGANELASALILGLGEQELELAHLVAGELGAGEVVALDQHLHAQRGAGARQRLERGAGAGQGDLARVGRTRPDHRHGAS